MDVPEDIIEVASEASSEPDYGYEEHIPSPRRHEDDLVFVGNTRSSMTAGIDTFPSLDGTEVSHSSPSINECTTVSFAGLKEADYPPMPAERQARTKRERSFRRRGGAVHSVLLKSAVMASMMYDSDDGGPNHRRLDSNLSGISLQSMQDALHANESSPRKRVRRVRRKSDKTSGDEANEVLEAFNTLQFGSKTGAGSRKQEPLQRTPPARRVSRKTSYDSRVSDFDSSEFNGSDWEDS